MEVFSEYVAFPQTVKKETTLKTLERREFHPGDKTNANVSEVEKAGILVQPERWLRWPEPLMDSGDIHSDEGGAEPGGSVMSSVVVLG